MTDRVWRSYHRESGEVVELHLSDDATAISVFIDGEFARVLGVDGPSTPARRIRALWRALEWQRNDVLMVGDQ